jgi:hypothetical protein
MAKAAELPTLQAQARRHSECEEHRCDGTATRDSMIERVSVNRSTRKARGAIGEKFGRAPANYGKRFLASTHKQKCVTIPARNGTKELRPELREFLDRCVVPALVEKWFAEWQEKDRR